MRAGRGVDCSTEGNPNQRLGTLGDPRRSAGRQEDMIQADGTGIGLAGPFCGLNKVL